MKKVALGVAVGLLVSASQVFAAATITGTVKYTGDVPTLKPIDMSADPACKAQHAKPVTPDVLVLGSGNTLGDAFVRVKSGLPAGKKFTAPTTPAVLDQKGCMYAPKVVGVMVGQTLKVKNSDPVLHNVHGLPKVNPGFNLAMPKTKKETDRTFRKAEDFFSVKCDVHPWMNATIAVMEHPYFSATGPDGKFTISGLDAGTYEIEAWHAKLGTQTMKVTVGAAESKSVDFAFAKPAK